MAASLYLGRGLTGVGDTACMEPSSDSEGSAASDVVEAASCDHTREHMRIGRITKLLNIEGACAGHAVTQVDNFFV